MNVDCFLDTNILIYAAAGRDNEEAKRHKALALIENENFGLSAQVLQEFYVSVVRKIAIPLSPVQALEWIDYLAVFPCVPIDSSLVRIAVEVSQRYQISYWDGAIIAAADISQASILYSEDLNAGQQYSTVRVVNPFLEL